MVRQGKLFEYSLNVLLCAISVLMLTPFLLVISISLSSEDSIIRNGYRFIPDTFDLIAYRYIFAVPDTIIRSYGITAVVTAIGTVSGLLLTAMLAYSISRPGYKYRRVTSFYVFFTMLFSGGLVPYYILMTQYLHLKDSMWAMILPGLLNAWNVLVLKGFLLKIPAEILESAKIDGAGEWRIFFAIVIPLSKPALATLGLLIAFGYWNEWFNALLYIDSPNLVPLQLLLVRMLSSLEIITSDLAGVGINLDLRQFPSNSARMAMVVLAAGPMMFVFPFFQRYFVQGLTVGSLKG